MGDGAMNTDVNSGEDRTEKMNAVDENRPDEDAEDDETSDRIVTRPRIIDLYLASQEELEDIPGIDDEVAHTVFTSIRPASTHFHKFINR
jgi:hypothetical protein